MQQYADLLTQRLQQRQALRAAEKVPLLSGRSKRGGDASDSEKGSDSEGSGRAPLQRQRAAKAASKLQRDGEAAAQDVATQPWLNQLEPDTELLDEYQLSSDDGDEELGRGLVVAPAAADSEDSDVELEDDGGSDDKEARPLQKATGTSSGKLQRSWGGRGKSSTNPNRRKPGQRRRPV